MAVSTVEEMSLSLISTKRGQDVGQQSPIEESYSKQTHLIGDASSEEITQFQQLPDILPYWLSLTHEEDTLVVSAGGFVLRPKPPRGG